MQESLHSTIQLHAEADIPFAAIEAFHGILFPFLPILRREVVMNTKRKRLLFCLAIPLLTGGLSALLTRGAMEDFSALHQPPGTPPDWMFPVVWTILYALMGYASYRILNREESVLRDRAWRTYLLQLGINFAWPILFFCLSWHAVALAWLALLGYTVIRTIFLFRSLSRPAAGFLVPYLLWLGYAFYLNAGVLILN